MHLNGQQFEELSKLLRLAFNRHGLRRTLRIHLDRELNDVADHHNFLQDVEELILTADREGWVAQLIAAAKKERPLRPDLQEFGGQFDADAAAVLPGKELESMLNLANPLLDAVPWLDALRNVLPRVCRVEIAGQAAGTGFLVGPQTVMTCHHVVVPRLPVDGQRSPRRPEDLIIRFDYHRTPGGAVNNGTTCRLAAKDWLVDARPPSPLDRQKDPAVVPGPTELDYALLRLEKATEGRARGWLEPSAVPLQPGDPLFIVHYPGQDPQRLSLDTKAVLPNQNLGPRVRYRTNTVGNSSGAPCFNARWQLVALHHGTNTAAKPAYNQGIPFTAILKALKPGWLGKPRKGKKP
jgi:hypothetical protein